MSETEHRAQGSAPDDDVAPERTPRELLRFRRRAAAGYYDLPSVADVVARRLLARGDLDPPPPDASAPLHAL